MKRLGELLIEVGWLRAEQLRQALRTQEILGGRLGTCLLELGALDEEQLLRALSHQLGVRSARLKDLDNIPVEVYSMLPREVAVRQRAVPFRVLGSEVYVALLDVHDRRTREELAAAIGRGVSVHVGNEARILAALESCYGEPMSERFRQLRAALDSQAAAARRLGAREPTYDSLEFPAPIVPPLPPPSPQPDRGQPRAAQARPPEDTVAPATAEAVVTTPRVASEPDRIAQALVADLLKQFRRVLLFAARRDGLHGWAGAGESFDVEGFGLLSLAAREPSIFMNLDAATPYYRGPMPALASHQRIAACWGGGLPNDCLAVPLRIQNRLVAAVLCEPVPGVTVPVAEIEARTLAAARELEAFILRSKAIAAAAN